MTNSKLIYLIIAALILAAGYYVVAGNRSSDVSPVMEEDQTLKNNDEMEKEEMMDKAEDAMEKDTMQKSDTEESGKMMEDDSNVEGAAIKTFEVVGGGFYFNPNELNVTEGDTVKIVFTNGGGTHDWVIEEFNARTPILQTGESAPIEFVADKAGSFEYYCSVGEHRKMGMVGTLVVEPKE